MKFLVTGSAGFIGFHLARRLLDQGHEVLGYDGMTPYYDVTLKRSRNEILLAKPNYQFVEAMLEDKPALDDAFARFQADVVVHLAAQAGVRYGLDHPESYISANIIGTQNLLEAVRSWRPRHLLIASTSSVYGGNEEVPFSEDERTDFPVSLYAATKKACEALSHSHAHLWKIPTTCFRFFTVYGTWGRPDMALYKFVDLIERGEPLEIYGMGQMRRDASYVGDLIEAIVRLTDSPPEEGMPVKVEGGKDSLSPVAPWRTVNIGGGEPVPLLEFVDTIERHLGKTAQRIMLPMQKGDVVETYADTALLRALTGFVPTTSIDETVRSFVDWYREYRRT